MERDNFLKKFERKRHIKPPKDFDSQEYPFTPEEEQEIVEFLEGKGAKHISPSEEEKRKRRLRKEIARRIKEIKIGKRQLDFPFDEGEGKK